MPFDGNETDWIVAPVQNELTTTDLNLLGDLVIHELVEEIEPVGSRETCDPPPTDTDADFLVLVDQASKATFFEWLDGQGFQPGGSVGEWMKTDHWFTARRGIVNLIMVDSRKQFDRFMLATKLAKRFNLLDKQDRVDLFEAIGTNGDC